MKLLVLLSLLAQASAFTVVGKTSPSKQRALFAEYEPMEGESKINLKVRRRKAIRDGNICMDYSLNLSPYLTPIAVC